MWLTRRDGLALALAMSCKAAAQGLVDGQVGLSGLDPVSDFLPGGPQSGLAGIETADRDRTWRFASHADRAALLRDPSVYTPRLGGHDDVSVLDGRLVDADARIFAVIEDRLTLFRGAERRARLLAGPAQAARAEASWPSLARLTNGGRA